MRERVPGALELIYDNYNARAMKGKGNVAGHIVLTGPEMLDEPDVRQLMDVTLEDASVHLDPTQCSRPTIKSVSEK